MARWLALEWDSLEARAVIGSVSARKAVVEDAFAIDLSDLSLASGDAIGARLASACAEHQSGRAGLVVGVPRSRAEARMLQIPPAPEAELPDMVRFQAIRQFASLGDDWALDYVALPSGQDETIPVLAAAVTPETLERVRAVSAALGLHASRLTLRSFSSTALLRRAMPDADCRLLVELLGDETELTIVSAGQVLFLRSVRLPAEDPAGALGPEIRRTVAAAQNQLGKLDLQTIVLAGREDELAPLLSTLSEAIPWPVVTWDPFTALECEPSFRVGELPRAGRYAAALGMLLEAAESTTTGLDFLSPRRRPEPPNRRRTIALAVAAVATIALLASGAVWYRFRAYEDQLAQLREQSQSRDPLVQEAKQVTADVSVVDRFAAGSVNWLDELYELSQKFPASERAIVNDAAFQGLPDGGGRIELKGYAADPSVINEMERDLRDSRHQVGGSGTQFDDRQSELRWSFSERIEVLPVEAEESSDEQP